MVLFKQSALYLLVGGFVYASDLTTFTIIVLLWPDQHLAGNAIAKVVGAAIGFLLHKYFTFSWKQKDGSFRQAGAYICLLGSNIIVGTALMYTLVDILALPKFPTRIGIDGIIIVATFFVSRHLVFRKARSKHFKGEGFTT